MLPRGLKTLADIRDAAEFILAATADESEESYRQNRMLRQAVERNFEIIGEAMRRLRDSDPELMQTISDAPRIIGFRNLLIHGYDLVNDETVWMTIQQYLPRLLSEIALASDRLQSESSSEE